MNAFDLAVFHFVNHFAGLPGLGWLDFLMKFFAKYALELYAILFIIAWFTFPKRDAKHRHALVVAVFAGVLALLINVVISHVWFRARPFVTLHKGDFTQLLPHSNDASFPSDHTSGSFGFAAASWGKNVRWVSHGFTTLAIIVMVARVYCGLHWPTDVIGGLIVGTVAGRLMWKLEWMVRPITKILLRIFRYGNGGRNPGLLSESHRSM